MAAGNRYGGFSSTVTLQQPAPLDKGIGCNAPQKKDLKPKEISKSGKEAATMPKFRGKGVILQKNGFQTGIGHMIFSENMIWPKRFLILSPPEGRGKPTKAFFSQLPPDLAYKIGVENPLRFFRLKK
jgi:hypothetical protein